MQHAEAGWFYDPGNQVCAGRILGYTSWSAGTLREGDFCGKIIRGGSESVYPSRCFRRAFEGSTHVRYDKTQDC